MKSLVAIFMIAAFAGFPLHAATTSVSADSDTGLLKQPKAFFEGNAEKIVSAIETVKPLAWVFHFDRVPYGYSDFELKAAIDFNGDATEGFIFGFCSSDPNKVKTTWQRYTSYPVITLTDSMHSVDKRCLVKVPETKKVWEALANPHSQLGSLTVVVFDGLDDPNLVWMFHWFSDQDSEEMSVWRRVFPRPIYSLPLPDYAIPAPNPEEE